MILPLNIFIVEPRSGETTLTNMQKKIFQLNVLKTFNVLLTHLQNRNLKDLMSFIKRAFNNYD